MKIKFISFNYTSPFSFNPVYYWLKSFYKKTGTYYNKYTWLKPEHVHTKDIVNKIVQEKPDILCLSIFVWNADSIMSVAKEVKERLPYVTVICGGPECDAHTDPNWFDTYPFVDYAVYGDGEKAFADLLDYFQDNSIDYSSIPNIVTRESKNKHQIFKFNQYPSYNPYLDLREEFLKDYTELKQSIGGKPVYLPYEIARGCMYNCSFCDWHGGIHHKVNRRIHDWKEDVDFFVENGIRAFQTDANVGIFKEDVDLYEYVAEKAQPGKMIPIEPRNMAKLNKDRVEQIWNILSSIDSQPRFPIKSAVQSVYTDTLLSIDRPDISWEEHKAILRRVKKNSPQNGITVEVITGLPGMTLDRIKESFLQFAEADVDTVFSYDWMLLKKAPAASQSYRDKNNLEFTKTFYPALFEGSNVNTRPQIKDFISDPNNLIVSNQAYYIDMIYDKDAGVKALIYHKLLNTLYNTLKKDPRFNPQYLNKIIDNKNSSYMEFIEREEEIQKGYLNQYGFFFWGSMDENSGTIQVYDELFKKII